MRIDVLTFAGCPSATETWQRVRAVAAEEGVDAQVRLVDVETQEEAEARRFLGSPTVQIDGADIEVARRGEKDYALMCRVYRTPQGLDGTPPSEMIRAAVHAAHRQEKE